MYSAAFRGDTGAAFMGREASQDEGNLHELPVPALAPGVMELWRHGGKQHDQRVYQTVWHGRRDNIRLDGYRGQQQCTVCIVDTQGPDQRYAILGLRMYIHAPTGTSSGSIATSGHWLSLSLCLCCQPVLGWEWLRRRPTKSSWSASAAFC